jgi:hypothetical protein
LFLYGEASIKNLMTKINEKTISIHLSDFDVVQYEFVDKLWSDGLGLRVVSFC